MKKTLVLVAAFAVMASCGDGGRKAALEQARKDSADLAVLADSLTKEIAKAHTAQNSLDVAGTYKGVIPCADCEGIEITLVLTSDTFVRTSLYKGKKGNAFEEKGPFTWNADGNTIILGDIKDAPNQYFVGENFLKQLDLEGKVITGEHADKYILKK